MAELRCWKCGKLHTEINQFEKVHQAGLSLKGTCTNCGESQGVGSLWSCKERVIFKESRTGRAAKRAAKEI